MRLAHCKIVFEMGSAHMFQTASEGFLESGRGCAEGESEVFPWVSGEPDSGCDRPKPSTWTPKGSFKRFRGGSVGDSEGLAGRFTKGFQRGFGKGFRRVSKGFPEGVPRGFLGFPGVSATAPDYTV